MSDTQQSETEITLTVTSYSGFTSNDLGRRAVTFQDDVTISCNIQPNTSGKKTLLYLELVREVVRERFNNDLEVGAYDSQYKKVNTKLYIHMTKYNENEIKKTYVHIKNSSLKFS